MCYESVDVSGKLTTKKIKPVVTRTQIKKTVTVKKEKHLDRNLLAFFQKRPTAAVLPVLSLAFVLLQRPLLWDRAWF